VLLVRKDLPAQQALLAPLALPGRMQNLMFLP
jgi:hypothetical protein